MRRVHRPLIVVAVVASAALVLAVGLLSFTANRRVVQSSTRVAETRETLGHVRRIVATVRDAETRQRGYLLTGDPAYLAPYDSADEVVTAELRLLQAALADDPGQPARLDTLAALSSAKFAELASTIAVRDSVGLAAAARAVRTDEGKHLMDEIARVADDMERAMNTRLASLQREEAERSRTATVVIVLATLVAFGLALAASAVLVGTLRALERAQGEQRVRTAQQVGVTAASTAVASAQTLERLLETAVRRTRDLIGAHKAVVSLTAGDPAAAPIRAVSASDEYAHERDTDEAEDRSAAEVLSVPLTDRDGRSVGSIQLVHKYEGEFTEEDEAVALQLSRLVSVAIENFRVYAEAHQARVDAERARAAAEEALLEAERANAAKSAFLSTMSHEIRTPINAIIGYAELLELGISGPTTPEQQAQLARIRLSGRHLLGLVSEVLDLSRLEAGRLELSREVGRAGDEADAALTLLRSQAAAKGIALDDECGGARAARYAGDPQRVRQILVNLVSNGIKFTEPGGRVSVRCESARTLDDVAEVSGSGPWVGVHVEDTGIGMGKADLRRIFQPFTQAQTGLTRTQGGVGLGLTISRQLARLMGGDLTVKSEPGKGSCFTLWLPAPDATAPATASDTPSQEGTPDEPDGGRELEVAGTAMLGAVDEIVTEHLGRLRRDPALSRARRLTDVQLADHTASFLSDIAQSLVILGTARGDPANLMRDGSEIQRVISERHGAQRQRLGWMESEIAREFQILREVVVARIVTRTNLPERELGEALEVLHRFLEQAERISRAGLRHAHAAATR